MKHIKICMITFLLLLSVAGFSQTKKIAPPPEPSFPAPPPPPPPKPSKIKKIKIFKNPALPPPPPPAPVNVPPAAPQVMPNKSS